VKHYELMYIVDSAAEEGLDEVKQKIEGIITGREGVVASYDKLGKKRLAYTIAKRQYGTYYLVNFRGTGKIVGALEYYLRLNPIVLRHILLAFTEKDLGLRERTNAVQLEEAERMRMGGRPLGTRAGGDDESLDILVPEDEIIRPAFVGLTHASDGGIEPVAEDPMMDKSNDETVE